ncbi:hypothetical protein GC722_01605 [Auraticoccus sp. F435]|uniref:Carboxymuconolactone decarboxylase family protein n=1 Tax=Auraticoccus cholistanensis TaxID=2656650 RepID=A0A6A9UPD3_9ACTN|nr:hypothetical protein [Auraticoccus cholistanensis]MVA74736.1 hypothetical protein [Auraticoccus cholistanensis]
MDTTAGFLGQAPASAAAERLMAEDREDVGYVMNLTRVWAHAPELSEAWAALTLRAAEIGGIDFVTKGVLVSAAAASRGDSYCALAWGSRLAGVLGDDVARAVLTGDDHGLDERRQVLAAWARRVVGDPNSTTAEDVQRLREVGLEDRQILGVTVYVAMRQAFSTVNDALGARPDAELSDAAPEGVREAVSWGRPTAG